MSRIVSRIRAAGLLLACASTLPCPAALNAELKAAGLTPLEIAR